MSAARFRPNLSASGPKKVPRRPEDRKPERKGCSIAVMIVVIFGNVVIIVIGIVMIVDTVINVLIDVVVVVVILIILQLTLFL